MTAPLNSPVSTAQIGNVAAEANLHRDDEYIDALNNCCIHNLRDSACPRSNTTCGKLLLCKEYQDDACSVIQFHHGSFLHIKPNCNIALVNGECFLDGCKFGHDNLDTRRERWQQAKCEGENGRAMNRRELEASTQRLLQALKDSIRQKASTVQRIKMESLIRKLSKKLEIEVDGKMSLQGELRNEVVQALKSCGDAGNPPQQNPSVQQSEHNSIWESKERAQVEKAIYEQLGALNRAMDQNATAGDHLMATDAAKKLRTKLESEDDGEKALKDSLNDKVIAALRSHDKLNQSTEPMQQHLQTSSKLDQPIQSKELMEAPTRVITPGELLNRKNLDIATCKQIETLERAMSSQGTPLDRIEAKAAAAKLWKKRKSKTDTGEKVIKANLKGRVWTTLAAYNEWLKQSS